jgi:kynurenine formamidase
VAATLAGAGDSLRIVDLSYRIDFAPRAYGPKGGAYTRTTTIAGEGVENADVLLDLHAGTHIDPPAHFVAGGATIDQLPLDIFIRPAVVGEVPNCAARQSIGPDDVHVPGGWETLSGKALLIHTGWSDRMYEDPGYYPLAPYLTEACAEKIVESGVRIVVLDCPPDRLDLDPATDRMHLVSNAVHRTLLGNGVPIVENVHGMSTIRGLSLWLVALPLAIDAGCGSPARVVVLEWD